MFNNIINTNNAYFWSLFYGTALVHTDLLLLFAPLMQNQLVSSYKKKVWKISTAETKIIVALCYYALLGISWLIYFSLDVINQNVTVKAIQQHFVCEASGSGKECDRSGFETLGYEGLIIVTYLLLGLVPTVMLIFVVNWSATKSSCHRIWERYFRKSNQEGLS